jgi:hypothetical protein
MNVAVLPEIFQVTETVYVILKQSCTLKGIERERERKHSKCLVGSEKSWEM